jgi:hypothetical protein
MIKATELQEELSIRLNRSDRGYSNVLTVKERDLALTEAYHLYYDTLVKYAELDNRFRNLLRQMEYKGYKANIKIEPEKNFYLVTLPKDYYSKSRMVCIAEKESCGEKELIVRPIASNKISEAMLDPYMKPSFEYEETFADEFKDGFALYFKDFKVKEVIIDYFIKPDKIQTPSLEEEGFYYDFEGSKVEVDKGIPLTSTIQKIQIVDIAALIILRNKGDITDYQSQLNKIISINSLEQTFL